MDRVGVLLMGRWVVMRGCFWIVLFWVVCGGLLDDVWVLVVNGFIFLCVGENVFFYFVWIGLW